MRIKKRRAGARLTAQMVTRARDAGDSCRQHGPLPLSAEQLQQIVRAIRESKVDALLLTDEDKQWLFTLKDTESAYRLLIENMSEGAMTLTREGAIIYANRAFADRLGRPLDRVIGAPVAHCVDPLDRELLLRLLADGARGKSSIELDLPSTGDARI
ncbi:MAG TPA: PAS domain-containing protein, partial [Telluria sp.]|nr:PAS domain-containing protein [Telluria sp.]